MSTSTEIRDRENGSSISVYVNGAGKPHILTARGSETIHFEPSQDQLRRLRGGIDGLLNLGPGGYPAKAAAGAAQRDVIEEALARAQEARKLLDASWTPYFNKKACPDLTTDSAKDAMAALDNLVRVLQFDLADAKA